MDNIVEENFPTVQFLGFLQASFSLQEVNDTVASQPKRTNEQKLNKDDQMIEWTDPK